MSAWHVPLTSTDGQRQLGVLDCFVQLISDLEDEGPRSIPVGDSGDSASLPRQKPKLDRLPSALEHIQDELNVWKEAVQSAIRVGEAQLQARGRDPPFNPLTFSENVQRWTVQCTMPKIVFDHIFDVILWRDIWKTLLFMLVWLIMCVNPEYVPVLLTLSPLVFWYQRFIEGIKAEVALELEAPGLGTSPRKSASPDNSTPSFVGRFISVELPKVADGIESLRKTDVNKAPKTENTAALTIASTVPQWVSEKLPPKDRMAVEWVKDNLRFNQICLSRWSVIYEGYCSIDSLTALGITLVATPVALVLIYTIPFRWCLLFSTFSLLLAGNPIVVALLELLIMRLIIWIQRQKVITRVLLFFANAYRKTSGRLRRSSSFHVIGDLGIDVNPDTRRTFVTYENQRWWLGFWTDKTVSMRPEDEDTHNSGGAGSVAVGSILGERFPWSDQYGQHYTPKTSFRLPSGDWEWKSLWTVDKSSGGTDDEGWEYAASFAAGTEKGFHAEVQFGDFVRRRKWIRKCRKKILLPLS